LLYYFLAIFSEREGKCGDYTSGKGGRWDQVKEEEQEGRRKREAMRVRNSGAPASLILVRARAQVG
jgi:hypothetical protein